MAILENTLPSSVEMWSLFRSNPLEYGAFRVWGDIEIIGDLRVASSISKQVAGQIGPKNALRCGKFLQKLELVSKSKVNFSP